MTQPLLVGLGSRVNAGCGTHYADGWLNTDLVENDDTRPDVIVTAENPLPFGDGTVDRLYLGHVLEHLKLDELPGFLAEARRVMRPGGELLVTGPDVYRTINRWYHKHEPWELVRSVLEHAAYPGTTDWPGALHHWNCHEARVVEALTLAGFDGVLPLDPSGICDGWQGWPVVNWAPWQCAVQAEAP